MSAPTEADLAVIVAQWNGDWTDPEMLEDDWEGWALVREILAALSGCMATDTDLAAAGVLVAALDLFNGTTHDTVLLGKLADQFISDGLRERLGQPCLVDDTLSALYARVARRGRVVS